MTTKQPPSIATLEDRYQRAKHLMQGVLTNTVAFNTTVYPTWISDSDCFWYARESQNGKQYRLVNAQAATNALAFDHAGLAATLAEAASKELADVDANNLPITKVEMVLNSGSSLTDATVTAIHFTAFGQDWTFDATAKRCHRIENRMADQWMVSPDGKQAAFTKDFNLWVRDLESGDERALTHDGEADFVYAVAGGCWGYTMGPAVQARWSSDSKRIFTVQRDSRQVKDFPLLHHVPKDGSIRPKVTHYKAALPGDEGRETLRLLSIHVDDGTIQAANYRQIPTTRNSYGIFSVNLAWWSKDSRRAYFVDMEQDYKTVRVVAFDTYTGHTQVLFQETADTQINLMSNDDEFPTFMPLVETNELLWFSERSGWGHLYLYDLNTGDLKKTVTQGDWLVRGVVSVDHLRREAFVQTTGRVAGRDPYYRDLCRVHLETGELTPVLSSDDEINVVMQSQMNTIVLVWGGLRDVGKACGVSPTGHFAVVTQSRADTIPRSFLINRDGEEILDLEIANVDGLPDNWQWPEPVQLLSADGKTDIHGLVYRPSHCTPDESYPVVSSLFSTPEIPWVSKGSFTNGAGTFGWPYLDAAALAELGFIVVQIDGRGTPGRSKAFRDEHYGKVESASNLEDHVAGIKQLAKRYPYMDIDRVGITSHISGGAGAVQGLLQHPDFYTVGVGGCLHDSRFFSASMWGDKYEDLSGPGSALSQLYPEDYVENLQGKLLLTQGMMDTSCPPAIVFRFIEALQKANKDFDLIMLPRLGHAPSNYLTRRSWDYLVQHLLGETPCKDFKLTNELDSMS